MSVQTYDPKLIVVTLGGVPIVGFSENTFLTVSRDADAFTKVVGAQGDVARAKSNNKSGTVTIVLHQASLSNDYLSQLATADELTGLGVVPLMVKDVLGTSLFFSGAAWVRKAADSSYSKEIEDREWVLDCDSLQVLVGGNAPTGV